MDPSEIEALKEENRMLKIVISRLKAGNTALRKENTSMKKWLLSEGLLRDENAS